MVNKKTFIKCLEGDRVLDPFLQGAHQLSREVVNTVWLVLGAD